MHDKSFQPFLLVVSAVVATMLGTAPAQVQAQAQNTNTTVQQGRVCINRTAQYGDSNDNATYQDCKVNINRTVQRGKENRNETAQFGRRNTNETRQGRGFKRTDYRPTRSKHNAPKQHRSKRARNHRAGGKRRND